MSAVYDLMCDAIHDAIDIINARIVKSITVCIYFIQEIYHITFKYIISQLFK